MNNPSQTQLRAQKAAQKNPEAAAVMKQKQKSYNPNHRNQMVKNILWWGNASKKFLNEVSKPKSSDFRKMLRVYATSAILVGAFCYVIKVVHIPINNIIVGTSK